MDGAAAGRVVVDLEGLVLAADLVEQPSGAVHVHQAVVGAVGDQSGAGDVSGDPLHGEVPEPLPGGLVVHSSQEPSDHRLEVLAEEVEVVEQAVAAAPGHQRLDARVEGRGPGRVVAGHADAHERHAPGVHLRPGPQVVDAGPGGDLVVRPGRDPLDVHGRAPSRGVHQQQRPAVLQHLPAAEEDLLGEGVGAPHEEDRGPLARGRVPGVAEVAVVLLVAASDAHDLDGRIVERRGRPEALLRLPEPLRLDVVLRDGQEHVRHAEVLVGVEEGLPGRAFMARGQRFPGPGLGLAGQTEPRLLPRALVAGVEAPAQARDVEHVAASLLGFGHESKRLGAHDLGGKEEVDHVTSPRPPTAASRAAWRCPR